MEGQEMVIPVVLALLAAVANAAASNLQRLAARTVPDSKAFRFSLIVALIRHPVWLGGIAALIAGFVFQAAALSQGPLALVQPVLITELPFTMLFLSTKLAPRVWLAMAVMAVGLIPGRRRPDAAADIRREAALADPITNSDRLRPAPGLGRHLREPGEKGYRPGVSSPPP
jgi:drug/metabolite transporter (DMT)-like permease